MTAEQRQCEARRPCVFCSWGWCWRRARRLGLTSWMLRRWSRRFNRRSSAGSSLLPECHSAERTEADIDLVSFATLADIRKHPQVWQKVGEMLDSGQMPPKDAKQPTDAERTQSSRMGARVISRPRPKRGPAIRGGRPAPAQQCRIHLHAPRSDGRRFARPGARVPGRRRGGRRVHEHRQRAGHVAGARDQVSGRRQGSRRPCGAAAGRISFLAARTPRDWTNETLARIREFYREFTDPAAATRSTCKGSCSTPTKGDACRSKSISPRRWSNASDCPRVAKAPEVVARERGLNAKYLGDCGECSRLAGSTLKIRHPRAVAAARRPADTLAGREAERRAGVGRGDRAWQKALWRFTSVGHIGKVGGPKAWLEPVSPLTAQQELRFKLPAPADGKDVTLYLVGRRCGRRRRTGLRRLGAAAPGRPGRPDLLLRDVRPVTRELAARRDRLFATTAKYLSGGGGRKRITRQAANRAQLAKKHGVEADSLTAWLDYLGIGS